MASVPLQITTPALLETRLGVLEFRDGAPTPATVEKVYENLDFTHALNVFLNCFQGASTYALLEGMRSVMGSDPGTFLLFSKLMDSQSLFLTANCDTIYCITTLDLSKGPMVLEVPPMALGAIDDLWFHWVIDLGLPGPDRGEGGKYLILPPDYEGIVPDSGFHVARSATFQAIAFMRFFLENNDPAPVVERIKKHARAYRYVPGGYGTGLASILDGHVPLAALAPHPPPTPSKFIEGSGLAFNTIPASDFRFFEQINALVQSQPATAHDAELTGQLAAIGIVKGAPFAPDARMKRILAEAAAVGGATSRALCFRFREKWAYYPDSSWQNMLFEGGYTFETPPAVVANQSVKPLPSTGARTIDARTAFFYAYTGVTPSMITRLLGVGSQYLFTFADSDKEFFDGGKPYIVTLPKNIPAKAFWSLTLYDTQSRSMLQTPQRFPRAGSQSYPTPAAVTEVDGSTVIHIGPEKPPAVKDGNWIQTMRGKGWFVILRLYNPLEAFFMKTWRPSEVICVA